MPGKSATRYRLTLPQAMRVRHLLYPQEQRVPASSKNSRMVGQNLVNEMLASGDLRLSHASGGIRFRRIKGKKGETPFVGVRLTRLGSARILANTTERKGNFHMLGGKEGLTRMKAKVASAYLLTLMAELAEARLREWMQRHKGRKPPADFVPLIRIKELMRELEKEKPTRKDRDETAIFLAERRKKYERPVRHDDLNPSQRRRQIDREKLIDFALFLLRHKQGWEKIQKQYELLWREQMETHLQRKIGEANLE